MKRILFLIRTLNIGGAEHVLVDIANRMTEDGFQVTIQTLIDEGYFREKLNPGIEYRGGIKSRFSIVRRVIQRLYIILPPGILGALLIGRTYSHLVAFTEGLPTKIISGCRQKHVKKIAWVHTDLYHNYQSKHFFGTHEKNRACYQLFDQVICVSSDAKDGFIKRMGPHPGLDVQYNPINKTEILQKSLCEPDYQLPPKEVFRLAALGRLSQVKGFDLLIDAMASVRKRVNSPVELYIIGGGPEEDALREQIHALDLQDTVYLCGQQTNPYSIMRQCDMQVISSRAEGYPLALCEGHFLGLPVVSTKCTGPTEIITASKGGILVDISAEGLAEGILEMISDPSAFAEYQKNVEIWSENYNVDAVYRQIEAKFS